MDELPRLARKAIEIVGRSRQRFPQNGPQPLTNPGPSDCVQVGLAGDHEPGRDRKTPCGELSEVRALASDGCRVLQADLFEPTNRLHDIQPLVAPPRRLHT